MSKAPLPPAGFPLGNQDLSKRGLDKWIMTDDDRQKDKWVIGWLCLALALILVGTVLLHRN